MLPETIINTRIDADHYQEVSRREQEIAEKKAALDDMKRKNTMVQDKVTFYKFFNRIPKMLNSGPGTNQNIEHEVGGAPSGTYDQ